MVEALGDAVAVFKPQSAFFEAYGSAGIAVLERTLADIAAAGALSLLDVKRGDIGSTMDAYARGLPRRRLAAGRRRHHPQPVPRLRLAGRRIDLAAGAGPRGLRAGPDQQPRGSAVPARPDRRRPHGRPGRGRRGRPAQHRAAGSGSARSASSSARRSVGPGPTSPRSTARSSPPGSAPRGPERPIWPRSSGRRSAAVLPTMSREVMGAGPDPAALRRRRPGPWGR